VGCRIHNSSNHLDVGKFELKLAKSRHTFMRAGYLILLMVLIGCGGSKPDLGPIQAGNYSAILSNTEVTYELALTILSDGSVTASGNYFGNFPPTAALPISASGNLTAEGVLHINLTGTNYTDEAHLNVVRTQAGFEGFDVFAGAPEVLFSIQADIIE